MKKHITIMVILFGLIHSCKDPSEAKNGQKTISSRETFANYYLLKLKTYKKSQSPVSYPLFDSFTNLYKRELASKMGNIYEFKLSCSKLKSILIKDKVIKLHFINNGRFSLAAEISGKYYLLNPVNEEFVEVQSDQFERYFMKYLSMVPDLEGTIRTKYGQTNYISISTNSLLNEINSLKDSLTLHLAQINPNYVIQETSNDSIQIKKLQDNCPYNLTLILKGTDGKGNKVYFDANNTYPPYP